MKRLLLSVATIAALAPNVLAQTTDPSPYCLPKFQLAADPANDYLDSINLNSGQFIHTSTLYNNSQYVYYNNLPPIQIKRGASNQIFVFGKQSTVMVSMDLLIDLNHDNTFDPVNETFSLYSGSPQAIDWAFATAFTVPASTDTGITRMRILDYGVNNGASMNPCPTGVVNSSSPHNGEVEDYNVRIVDAVTGIKEVANTVPMMIYPNPAKDIVRIVAPVTGKDVYVSVTDLMGKQVMLQPMPANGVLSVAQLAPSIYQLSLLQQGQVVSRTKLVIQ